MCALRACEPCFCEPAVDRATTVQRRHGPARPAASVGDNFRAGRGGVWRQRAGHGEGAAGIVRSVLGQAKTLVLGVGPRVKSVKPEQPRHPRAQLVGVKPPNPCLSRQGMQCVPTKQPLGTLKKNPRG